MATSTHNKYVSIPDWFSSSSSTPITSTEKPANITNVYYGGGGTIGITEIPIDNKTIVWQDQVITVPIDNDKIIINTEGKITTSGTTGGWELRQLTDGTNYIYTTYPVVTQLGITMYAGTDGLDLGSVYDGLPIDNATIYWDLDENGNKILKAVGSSGGVADSVAWVNVTGKPDWLLDGKIQYTEIEGIPDLSGFITKDYIDGKFVTFDLNETIDGIKTFTNGIKIGTSLINQSQNDVIYIDANLVVRGGITMYATGTVDIPSVLDSLPVAGTDSKGIASFDSSYFSVTNGKVTLLADNVGLNESELAEYLNTNNYAKKSDIPSLNGYATQSWVESKGYALNSDLMSLTTKVDDFLEGSDTDTIINKWLELEAFLSGLSESDNLATILSAKADKDYVDDTFVTLTTTQTITGEKNFTGGLKVNGSPIYYDTEKKYWKLEGDLLVTGGVTMYGNEGTYTPSTIMDAIAVDGTTISKDGGVLKVIGGTGGGVADSVAWANITGKPTWIGSSKPSYSYSEITGAISTTEVQNYLTSNSYLNVTSGDNRYLKLSGGTVTGTANVITINRTDLNQPCISYEYNGTSYGSIGLKGYGDAFVHNGNTRVINKIWHEGNLNPSDYLLLTGGTIKGQLTISKFPSTIVFLNAQGIVLGHIGYGGVDNPVVYMSDGATNYKLLHSGNIDSYKAGSATKLATARTIWGKSFDGTGNIDGKLLINTSISGDVLSFNDTRTTQGVLTMRFDRNDVDYGGINWFHDGYNGYAYNSTSHINIGHSTGFVSLGLWTSPLLIADIDKKCVGINNTTPEFALDVNGSVHSTYIKSGDAPPIAFPNYINSSSLIYQQWHTFVGYNGKGFIFGQDNTDSSIARLSIYGGDTTMSYLRIENAVEVSNNSENGSAVLRMCMNQTGAKDQNPNIEFMTGTAYIDWHYAGDTSVDYTTRLIEGAKGILTLKGGLNIDTTLSVTEDAEFKKRAFVKNYITFSDFGAVGGANTSTARIGTFDHNEGGIVIQLGKSGTGSTPIKQRFEIINPAWNVSLMSVDRSGNMLVNGGITMYSDQRKKTILNHVELSLKQIAEAPLIEHYYNSDDKKTTHVGSIAQYWAKMNDWFCKLDSEGYYTMEIQNAALASAISIARELDRYETKTDKAIKKLKKRICELEEEIERLKSA